MYASSVPNLASAGPIWEKPWCPHRWLSALLDLVCMLGAREMGTENKAAGVSVTLEHCVQS